MLGVLAGQPTLPHIARRSAVAITVFHSTVEVGRAEPHKQLSGADLRPHGPMVVYRADLRYLYLLVRGGNPEFANELDMTVEV